MSKTKTTEAKSAEWHAVLESLFSCGVFPAALNRVLLYGPPGTGKSDWALFSPAVSKRWKPSEIRKIELSEGRDVADLIGGFVPTESGGFACKPCHAAELFANGGVLILDEIDHAPKSVIPILHALLDDPRTAQLTMPDGITLRCHENFVVLATTNELPSALTPALQSRFSGGLILPCDTVAPGALADLPDCLSLMACATSAATTPATYCAPTGSRSVRAFHRAYLHLRGGNSQSTVSAETLARCFFGASAEQVIASLVLGS